MENLSIVFGLGGFWSITLGLSSTQLSDVMEHIGWRQTSAGSHYMREAQVLQSGGPSELLSHSYVNTDLHA